MTRRQAKKVFRRRLFDGVQHRGHTIRRATLVLGRTRFLLRERGTGRLVLGRWAPFETVRATGLTRIAFGWRSRAPQAPKAPAGAPRAAGAEPS